MYEARGYRSDDLVLALMVYSLDNKQITTQCAQISKTGNTLEEYLTQACQEQAWKASWRK